LGLAMLGINKRTNANTNHLGMSYYQEVLPLLNH